MTCRYDDSSGASTRCGGNNYNEDVTISTNAGDVIGIQTTWYSGSAAGDISLTVVCVGTTSEPTSLTSVVRPTLPVYCGDTVTVYGNFGVILDHLARVSQLHTTTTTHTPHTHTRTHTAHA